MKRNWILAGTTLAVCSPLLALLLTANMPAAAPTQQNAAQQPKSPPASDGAAGESPARSPAAFEALLARRDALLQTAAALETPEDGVRYNKKLAELDARIDAVGGARYCSASRFYWYTDLGEAQQAAQASGKPILSLRMMGRLTDEYSCANSRFFRTTLYANEEISQYLRDHFVMHWKSVRPVPKVTIDFGDGRKLERTLTGNSIHYVLDVDGQPLDALPGVYAPQKFLEEVKRSHDLYQQVKAAREGQRAQTSREQLLFLYHLSRGQDTLRQWQKDLQQIEVSEKLALDAPNGAPNVRVELRPAAEKATLLAAPKGRVEMPLVREVTMRNPGQLEEQTDEEMWRKIAALHAGEWKLDDASVRLIRSENPTAAEAAKLTVTKFLVEDPIVKMIRNLESSIALDTVRNEYQLRRQIHEWFTEQLPTDVEKLNDRVYAQLFLTPSSDPWIGLVPDATYTGLDNAGVVRPDAE
ncbi:MAG: hypothetical protein RIC55_15800 [Pirellulaceae bacterium]